MLNRKRPRKGLQITDIKDNRRINRRLNVSANGKIGSLKSQLAIIYSLPMNHSVFIPIQYPETRNIAEFDNDHFQDSVTEAKEQGSKFVLRHSMYSCPWFFIDKSAPNKKAKIHSHVRSCARRAGAPPEEQETRRNKAQRTLRGARPEKIGKKTKGKRRDERETKKE